ncbi:hypothetical protein H310_12830 [Aphanomyces invadans]|uniref:Uncharacterized protein n=1 Tax=Aphanomyces invadans TaxID=157072 RepID=A0A024TI40_9STRA|nr:hypothetical protein H310_12830 [Aphanomyces invadans]ETV92992.1 hypothetical protein H310_12830 [Aphanomyces invadans]|eukprot:XP_008878257.1 hypothetical protein H310_12830 [Aphanomyces invadans]
MKFLAGLVQVAVATKVVFDSHYPLDKGSTGFAISKSRTAAVRFHSLPASDDACESEGLTVSHVTFAMDTSYAAPGTVLQVGICSSVNDEPNCARSDLPGRISINTLSEQFEFNWSPTSQIVLAPSTDYWFTVGSNAQDRDRVPIWLEGTKEFNTDNDPKNKVMFAFTETQDGPWNVIFGGENRVVNSLQVFAN